MSIKKYILSVLLLSGIIALAGYYYLGGFNERELELVEVNGYHFAGRHYLGGLKNKALEDIFMEVRRQYETGEPAGIFSVVVLQEPATEKDSLEQFIGILTEEPVSAESLPSGWETFTLEADQAVQNTLRSHPMVMPKPYDIREEMKEFAAEKGLTLKEHITVEKYLGERNLIIEIPVKE